MNEKKNETIGRRTLEIYRKVIIVNNNHKLLFRLSIWLFRSSIRSILIYLSSQSVEILELRNFEFRSIQYNRSRWWRWTPTSSTTSHILIQIDRSIDHRNEKNLIDCPKRKKKGSKRNSLVWPFCFPPLFNTSWMCSQKLIILARSNYREQF